MDNLTKAQRTEAFEIIKNALLGATFGSSKKTNSDAYENEIYIDYVEFKYIQFVGQGSDDVDAFLNIILNSEYSCLPVKKIVFFKFPQFHMETDLGNNVYALAEDSAGLCYMVGGMTDYSGSGGASYRRFQLVVAFLHELYNIEVEHRVIEREAGSQLSGPNFLMVL